MITCVSLVTAYCLDQTETRDFYVDVLGFERGTDITMGEGFRWVTLREGRDVPAGAVRPAVRRGSGDARQHRQLAGLVEPREFAPEDFK
jgi:catechol 2,3-dioxygenase-like lactoylglutathione lyase family enzyme